MIFTEDHARQMIDRSKRQTRRPVKSGEYAIVAIIKGPTEHRLRWRPEIEPFPQKGAEIIEVRDANGRLKWKVGKNYAAQTGRGKKAIGRTPPIEAIRRERLNDITPQDAKKEGASPYYADAKGGRYVGYYVGFAYLWDSIYEGTPNYWGANPEVWVLEFEKVKE